MADSSEPAALFNAREQVNQQQVLFNSGGESAAKAGGGSTKGGGRRGSRRSKRGKAAQDKKRAIIPAVAMEDDALTMPGQRFAVVSFVDKRDYTGMTEGEAKNLLEPQNLIKIRGVFATHERAAERVKDLMTMDPYFDLHIIACGTWTLIGAGKGEDTHYENEGIQDIMSGFFQQHYTDVDNLRNRIDKAKKAGLAGLDAQDPDALYEAAQEVADVTQAEKRADPLPTNVKPMDAKAAAQLLAKKVPAGEDLSSSMADMASLADMYDDEDE